MSAPCKDCGIDTTPCTGKRGCRHAGKWEYYMVRDRLWAKAGMKKDDGYLCIGCLEKRIGRALRARDLPDLIVNIPDAWDTPRLLSRRLMANNVYAVLDALDRQGAVKKLNR